jgi:hypothetical protein
MMSMMSNSPSQWPRRGRAGVQLLLVALAILLTLGTDAQQLSYSRGQTVSPAYEGWEQNDDGSFNFLFGYMNRNWEEELDIPIGADNSIELGGPDQGQPTHFLPRRNRFVFKVRVPKDFGEKEIVWTITVRGKTEKAYASLKPDYFVDNLIQASENGAIGGGTSSPEILANTPPVLRVEGDKRRTVRVGQPLTLTAFANDDGVPKPRVRGLRSTRPTQRSGETPPVNPVLTPPRLATVDSATGLRVSWFVYRGARKMTFDPAQIKVWEDTRVGANSPWAPYWLAPPAPPEGTWATRAVFSVPGTYVLRCRASDGALSVDEDVTVTVTR